jgi:hypothetical protein
MSEKKPSVILYYEEVERHYVRKERLIINQDTHPELRDMDQRQMVEYVKENMDRMKPTEEGYGSLMEQSELQGDEKDKYFFDSRDYVVEPYFPDQDEESWDENDDEDDDED